MGEIIRAMVVDVHKIDGFYHHYKRGRFRSKEGLFVSEGTWDDRYIGSGYSRGWFYFDGESREGICFHAVKVRRM